jgi:hypothetical protein
MREMVLLIGGYRISQAIYVAAELGIADVLNERPRTPSELAETVGAHEDSLYRVLRMLAGVGVLSETTEGTFQLTQLGAALRSDVRGTPSRNVKAMLHPANWSAWGHLLHAVRTGQTAFEDLHGMGVFEYMSRDATLSTIFDEAMSANTARGGIAIADSYDFSRIETIVDVGGGRGELLAALLKANAHLRGILFERPQVAHAAIATFAISGLARRCRIENGDFFQALPAGASAYLLSHVVHDWDDERAVLLLRNCRSAAGDKGRILIFERLIGLDHVAGLGALHVDMEMMVNTGGRERSQDEYRSLIETAGLRISRILPVPTAPDHSIIECTSSVAR